MNTWTPAITDISKAIYLSHSIYQLMRFKTSNLKNEDWSMRCAKCQS